MKAIMMTVRLWWFYLTYKGIKKAEIRKKFAKNFKGKIFECVSKTNWKKDLMKIPAEEREFFKQFVGKVGLCFECDKVEEIICSYSHSAGNVYHYNKNGNMIGMQEDLLNKSCLDYKGIFYYLKDKNGYAIRINKLEIFDEPKEIKEFYTTKLDKQLPEIFDNSIQLENGTWVKPLTRAPESYCYIEV